MVRAILENRKTQTRRVIKPQPDRVIGRFPAVDDLGDLEAIRCPYGKPGYRLWVRETWAPADKILFGSDLDECEAVAYKADGSILDPNGQHFNAFGIDFSKIRWKPSIHMRRDYSRILLEITDIRVERLQDIFEADAIAEGVEVVGDNIYGDPIYMDYSGESLRGAGWCSAYRSFQSIWKSINGPESWESNPWVWVVEFKRINQ